uniref:Uncharacterized protein n=1 Tax=Cucumis melo TaxID=3656 RepID=A0A9I9EFU9_CUCME
MQVVASISESKNGKLSHSVSLQALEIALQWCLCLLFLSGEVFFQLFFFIFLPSMLPSKAFSALILSNIIIVRDFWDSVSERMGWRENLWFSRRKVVSNLLLKGNGSTKGRERSHPWPLVV